MPTKQINFYATYDDIAKVLEQFEAQESIRYVLTGLFDVDTPQIFETYKAINSLSISLDGDANHIPGYLILEKRGQISIRTVPQKTGADKFAVDQVQNQDALYFQSGGVFSTEIIVPGRIGITNQTPKALTLYGAFARILMKRFRKVKSFCVGPEAYTLWQNGRRLGLSLKASSEIDLR